MTDEQRLLDQGHFTHDHYRQTMTTKELQVLIDERGSSPKAVRKGTVVDIKWKTIVPGRWVVWLEAISVKQKKEKAMEQYLYEFIAQSMWEAMNPGGVPWIALPNDEIRTRMRNAAQDILQHTMAIVPRDILGTEFRETWLRIKPKEATEKMPVEQEGLDVPALGASAEMGRALKHLEILADYAPHTLLKEALAYAAMLTRSGEFG